MKRIKKLLLLLTIGLISFLLSGCLRSMQLNERALVQAIGIDLEGTNIHLTLQIFSPSSSSKIGVSEAAENAKIISASGKSIIEAMENAARTQGKQLFIGHNRIIVIGRSMAVNGIKEELNYFSTASTMRHNTKLLVCDGTAQSVLTAKVNSGMLSAEALERLSESANTNGTLRNVKLYEFLRSIENRNDSAVIPMISIIETQQPQTAASQSGSEGGGSEGGGSEGGGGSLAPVSNVELGNTAIFTDGKMSGILDKKESRGLLWLQDRVRGTTIEIENEKFEIAAIKLFSSKSKLRFENKNGEMKFILDIAASATVGESLLQNLKQAGLDDMPDLALAAQKVIEEESRAAFEKAINHYEADVFNLGNIIWKTDKALWDTIHTAPEKILKNLSFEVNAKINIERTGLELSK